DRRKDTDGNRQRRLEYLLLKELQRRHANALAAMSLGGDEDVEIPRAGAQVVGQRLAPKGRVDRMCVTDRLPFYLDHAADGMRAVERHQHLGLGTCLRTPPALDIRPGEPAADEGPVAMRGGSQRHTSIGPLPAHEISAGSGGCP